MSLIIDFYRDESSWKKTAPSHPSCYTHFDIVRNWSDDKWNACHDFIQWLFPLKEPSNFNPDAPLLSDEDIQEFKDDKELIDALHLSFHRFLRFLGLRCRVLDGSWITEPIPPNECGIGDEFFTKAEIEKKQKVWEGPDHNWFRITRCLHSLRLLGQEKLTLSFFDCLCKLYNQNRGITPNTFQYWQDAAQGGLE